MKKFENIVIATDLDGTYFGTKTYMVERNLDRVKYFCENGGHFTFATGRLPLFIRKPIPNPREQINMPAVLGNGTCVYDYSEDRAIRQEFVDSNDVIEIVSYARSIENEIGSRATYDKGFVGYNFDNPIVKREYERLPDFIERSTLPLERWGELDLYKTNIVASEECIDRLYPILKEKYSHKVGVTRSASFMIEIIPLGVTKAAALERLVKEYFDRPMTLCCVGDYDNDLEMLRLADISACPSNANDNVKAICKHCLCSNDEGVIADLIDLLDMENS
jgi:Cof subfamily protein (haloacid dehalogenase superfamily)